ncbi:RNA polymerase sigma-B factor [Kitasatospora gansuensis]|uniref:RNA polymerase sigma-B factor n=1 Tax=Kitasatospora gansuensis TaxID=258050 RepID=A0A7W7SHB8_9ACTN|nr:SigB/SigF/SigG family RNA polymerase sigma factor [Kitasatospora gansuensis]MBB4950479.1 RNA polymerase sigma-B factor [Kitasatospora gansuensis]
MATSDTTTLLSAELHRPTHREMRAMGKTEARALSDALFARLADLERESAAYSYVRGTIIELNMPLVRFAAAGFRRGTAELDDILQVGTVGLIKAVDGYDHRRGVEFATYAIPTITGEIKRFFRDTSWPLRVPRSLQELYLRVARCSDRLEQTLGRLPTPEEIAEELGLDPAEVAAGLGVGRAYRADSLDALRQDRDDPNGSTLVDRLGACDREFDLTEFREAVRPLLRALPARERTVLALRFWGDCTQAEIAAEIGVSQMHVSRLLAGILSGLRERLADERDGPGGQPPGGSEARSVLPR